MMNLITAVSDCNARPCQKPSYFLRVELVLEAKVCETLCLSMGTEFTGECRDRNRCYGIDVLKGHQVDGLSQFRVADGTVSFSSGTRLTVTGCPKTIRTLQD